jgi:hypothetical protein
MEITVIAERGFYGDGRNKWIIWEQTAAVLGHETRCIAGLALGTSEPQADGAAASEELELNQFAP